MTRSYSTFSEIDPDFFRSVIEGSRDTAPETTAQASSGIMSPSTRPQPRPQGLGVRSIDTTPAIEESLLGVVAQGLARNTDNPEQLANAVVPKPSRMETPRLSEFDGMVPVEQFLRGDATREALGSAPVGPMPISRDSLPSVDTSTPPRPQMETDVSSETTMVAGSSIENSETFMGGSSVQRQLNNLGFRTSVDGAIGPRTRQNIGRYQVSIGLPATGYVDAATQEALQEGRQGRTLDEVESGLPFLGQTAVGTVLRAAEDMYYSPYTLNFQPVLPGNRRHDSGLTIGAGIDLGQYDADRLRRYGAPEEIVAKLEESGWLGLRPSNAVSENDRFRRQGHAALQSRYEEQLANGTLLSLTPEEIDTLTSVLYENQYLPIVRDAYNRTDTSRRVPFDALSEQAVAAMAAEAWHRPTSVTSNSDAFARAAANNDIAGITSLYFYPERGPKILTALGVR